MLKQTEFEFESNGPLPTVTSIWLPALYLLVFFFILILSTGKSLGVMVVCALFILLLKSLGQYSLKISVLLDQKTLEYLYLNAWGQERRTIIYIPTAIGRYKYTKVGRANHAWQLNLNSGKEKIRINAKEKGGFSKEQLDQVAMLIDTCKANN